MAAWDEALLEWAKKNDMSSYGKCPADILFPYAATDVRATLSLAKQHRKLLSEDAKAGISLYPVYASNMAMCYAIIEMMSVGIKLDKDELRVLKQQFKESYDKLLAEIRSDINWPEFDPNKNRHVTALLFGNAYVEKPVMPETAKCCCLEPVKSTNKRFPDWSKIPKDLRGMFHASVDAETLGILAEKHPLVRKLRDLRFIKQVLITVLGETGLETHIADDGAVRSFIAPTTETGRCRSSHPNIQNFSNRRNADYARICGVTKFPSDCIVARPGYKLVEMDFVAAELFLLGVMSGSTALIDHCKRSSLPESHNDHYDLHSQMAVKAFKLSCKPTKSGLELAGKKHLRVCAKAVIYGLNYGRGNDAIVRQVKAESGIDISVEDVNAIRQAFMQEYPEVETLMAKLRKVVYDPGYQVNYFGRVRRFKHVADDEFMAKQERESLNFAFQSMVADCLNRVAFYLMASEVKEVLDYRLLAPIHDAILFEVNEDTYDCFVNDYLPEIVALVKFGRWTPIGEKLTEPIYSLGFEIKEKG